MKTSLSFSRQVRLTSKAEYKHVFDESNKVSQAHMLALYKRNPKANARLGIVVGKRVAKSAVTRNTIKRVVRESFRAQQAQLTGIDIVIIARQSCGRLNKTQVREGIDKLWQRLLIQYQKVSP